MKHTWNQVLRQRPIFPLKHNASQEEIFNYVRFYPMVYLRLQERINDDVIAQYYKCLSK